jgi:hypothetical protein
MVHAIRIAHQEPLSEANPFCCQGSPTPVN